MAPGSDRGAEDGLVVGVAGRRAQPASEPVSAGGILAIVPGQAAIAVWSPGLNANGNSALGTRALELLAQRTGWSVFGG